MTQQEARSPLTSVMARELACRREAGPGTSQGTLPSRVAYTLPPTVVRALEHLPAGTLMCSGVHLGPFTQLPGAWGWHASPCAVITR